MLQKSFKIMELIFDFESNLLLDETVHYLI